MCVLYLKENNHVCGSDTKIGVINAVDMADQVWFQYYGNQEERSYWFKKKSDGPSSQITDWLQYLMSAHLWSKQWVSNMFGML